MARCMRSASSKRRARHTDNPPHRQLGAAKETSDDHSIDRPRGRPRTGCAARHRIGGRAPRHSSPTPPRCVTGAGRNPPSAAQNAGHACASATRTDPSGRSMRVRCRPRRCSPRARGRARLLRRTRGTSALRASLARVRTRLGARPGESPSRGARLGAATCAGAPSTRLGERTLDLLVTDDLAGNMAGNATGVQSLKKRSMIASAARPWARSFGCAS